MQINPQKRILNTYLILCKYDSDQTQKLDRTQAHGGVVAFQGRSHRD